MSRPIPERLLPEFLALLDAADNDDLPDGAWWAVLEEAAAKFLVDHKLSDDEACDAVHQWVAARTQGATR